MTLNEVSLGKEYRIIKINVTDDEVVSFLFSLGCYKDQYITVVTKKRRNMVVAIKDARYSIDNQLAELIIVE